MKGSEAKMLGYMEGADKRFIIPVYQRKYNWKLDNCRQLYEDLKKIVVDHRESHFFGSIVSAVVPNGSKIEYHIIDGQQRLTTITLLLLAICNLIKENQIKASVPHLNEQINQRFLISPWANEEDKIKLKPVKSDRSALEKLFGDEEDFDRRSNLTQNYNFFCEMLLREEISAEDLFAAVGKLEIISITLDASDNAQMIFESLNSTGLALTEGDKIRNYVLMGLPAKVQGEYYEKYWAKIERCADNDVSSFIRDYLSIKQQLTPNINHVYSAFKGYAQKTEMPVDVFLTDILKYARLYEKLCTCRSGLHEQRLNDCMYRMKRLETVVTRPFLMEVLKLNQDGKLDKDEVLQVFLIVENYLLRRNICEVPTNALNKIFLNLNREILRCDNTTEQYVDKLIYELLSKKESGRFPDDEEFAAALSSKQVYQMRGKYKAYLFERFENFGTVETKDVYTHLDQGTYTIEHIMPQHLTPAWMEALGKDASEIHAAWLHRLANLTLTGYNPNLSNKTFQEKRDAEEGGYKASGLKMNQKLAAKDAWTLTELEERNEEMIRLALKIWKRPETEYEPEEREFDSCTLDDENVDLTGKDIAKYSYLNAEQPVASWADMFEHVVTFLHQKDKTVLLGLVDEPEQYGNLSTYVKSSDENLRSALKIDDNIYIEKNIRTSMKITILRRIFALYDADPMDLVFYLRDPETGKKAESDRFETRTRYWAYALPLIQKENHRLGIFDGCTETTSNYISGTFGLSGFNISCVANRDQARIDFYLGNGNTERNKAAFDQIHRHKAEIEKELGVELTWERAEDKKASWICYHLHGVSINDEADWPRMAKFHAEWSRKISEAIFPYLFDQETMRLMNIAALLREWAEKKQEIHLNLSKCCRTYTRFTTDAMTAILPELKGIPSGWNTDIHYFYEIVSRDGNKVYIQLAISALNIPDDFRAICDRINEFYPASGGKADWRFRVPFKSSAIPVDEGLSRNELFAGLDQCLGEVIAFENDLKQKLQ